MLTSQTTYVFHLEMTRSLLTIFNKKERMAMILPLHLPLEATWLNVRKGRVFPGQEHSELAGSWSFVFCEVGVWGVSAPLRCSLRRLALTAAGRKDLRMSSRDALVWSGRVAIFSHPEPIEAFQHLFNI